MPELTVADVELYTRGRLLASEVETYRVLQRAYAAVRNYCNWHVMPSKVDTVTLNGPEGGRLLSLPTLQLTALTTVVEDGVTLNVSDLRWSVNGLVRKKSGACWSRFYRSIVVTMTHGYDVALDFNQAVLEAVDTTTLKVGTGGTGGLKRKKVDDVEREWQTVSAALTYESGLNESLLNQYRIIPPA